MWYGACSLCVLICAIFVSLLTELVFEWTLVPIADNLKFDVYQPASIFCSVSRHNLLNRFQRLLLIYEILNTSC